MTTEPNLEKAAEEIEKKAEENYRAWLKYRNPSEFQNDVCIILQPNLGHKEKLEKTLELYDTIFREDPNFFYLKNLFYEKLRCIKILWQYNPPKNQQNK
jgi:hypothetical protein